MGGSEGRSQGTCILQGRPRLLLARNPAGDAALLNGKLGRTGPSATACTKCRIGGELQICFRCMSL